MFGQAVILHLCPALPRIRGAGRLVCVRQRPYLLEHEDLLPPPVQRRSMAKCARVKAAALELFGDVGYENASLETIAARAGVAVGGIYLLFRSKRQLLLVLMDELLGRMASIDTTLHELGEPKAAIHHILARAFETDLSYAGAYRAWTEAARADRALGALDRRIRKWTSARLFDLFNALHESEQDRARTNV